MENCNQKRMSILIVMLLLTTLQATMIIHAESETTISFEDTMIPRGSTKNVDFFINDVENLGSFEIRVSWDPSVIQVKEVNGKQGFEVAPYIVDNNGYVNIAAYIIGNASGSVQPATFKIKAIGSVGESCILRIETSELLTADPNPAEISHTKDHGLITVDKQSTSGGSTGGGGGLPPPPANTPPVCDASLSEIAGFVNEPINFDGSESYDTDGSIASYDWDFDDGETGTGMTTSHQFNKAGTYEVTLTIEDNNGASASDTITVVIQASANNPPTQPDITGPSTGSTNESYQYSLSASDDDGDNIRYVIDWGDDNSETTEFSEEGDTIKVSHQWQHAGRFIITAQTDDNQTLSSSATHIILIDAMEISIDDETVGVITDTNGDGIYDRFDDVSDQISYQKANNQYLLDVDGDSNWDYTYNTQSDEITSYQGKENKQQTTDFSWIIIIGVIALVAIIGIVFYLMQSKQKKK